MILMTILSIGAGTTALAVACGYAHSCALRGDRRVVCWGGNQFGQLGSGNMSEIGAGPGQMGSNLTVADPGRVLLVQRFCQKQFEISFIFL